MNPSEQKTAKGYASFRRIKQKILGCESTHLLLLAASLRLSDLIPQLRNSSSYHSESRQSHTGVEERGYGAPPEHTNHLPVQTLLANIKPKLNASPLDSYRVSKDH